jgi:hypothetical protein
MATLYVLYQQNKDTNSASVYGTYTDQKNAERAAKQAKAGVDARFQTSNFYVVTVEATQVANEGDQQQQQQQATTVTGEQQEQDTSRRSRRHAE